MKFWADENFRGDILRGILNIYPNLDIIRVQDTELMSIKDPNLLEEASKVGAVLLTHDIKTIPPYANQRVAEGKPMSGVLVMAQNIPVKRAIEELAIFIGASNENDFINRVEYI
jgi:predicted nuclease of predicted toxin-antitoxin system